MPFCGFPYFETHPHQMGKQPKTQLSFGPFPVLPGNPLAEVTRENISWLWVKTNVGAPPILVFFSGDWDAHWGYGILTYFDPWPCQNPRIIEAERTLLRRLLMMLPLVHLVSSFFVSGFKSRVCDSAIDLTAISSRIARQCSLRGTRFRILCRWAIRRLTRPCALKGSQKGGLFEDYMSGFWCDQIVPETFWKHMVNIHST